MVDHLDVSDFAHVTGLLEKRVWNFIIRIESIYETGFIIFRIVKRPDSLIDILLQGFLHYTVIRLSHNLFLGLELEGHLVAVQNHVFSQLPDEQVVLSL